MNPPIATLQLLVLGAGPGGYTAAFRAADLGMEVTLVERWASLGGVCLNVGCIPSKALLHAAKVIDEARHMGAHGVASAHLQSIWASCSNGRTRSSASSRAASPCSRSSARCSRSRCRQVRQPACRRDRQRRQEGKDPLPAVHHRCRLRAVKLPFIPDDPRVMDSTGALELPDTAGKRMLVIGGGIIGLEMACVYEALGAEITVVELTAQLIPGCDADLVRPLEKRLKGRYEQILLNTKVAAVVAEKAGIRVTFEDSKGRSDQVFDRVLVAVGRVPNGKRIAAEAAGVTVNERGFIPRRQAAADQRAAHLRDRRHRRTAHARSQGDARGQGGS